MKKIALAAAVAFALTGCGAHVAPGAATMNAAALAAQSKKKAASKRPTPPALKKADSTRQGIAASNAARACDSALQQYQSLQYQWNAAYDDYTKDQIETQMLNVLHSGLTNTQSITSAQGVDATDRCSYDIADAGLDRYDSRYRQWQSTWDVTQKRYIVNDMLTDMVNTLQQIRNNY